jgi:hypothetical protein
MSWTLERMTGFLKRAGICLECGSRHTYKGQCLDCIIAEDKRVNWPKLETK